MMNYSYVELSLRVRVNPRPIRNNFDLLGAQWSRGFHRTVDERGEDRLVRLVLEQSARLRRSHGGQRRRLQEIQVRHCHREFQLR